MRNRNVGLYSESEIPTPLKKYETLQNLLDDPEIEEIWINAPERIFVAKNGKSALTNLIMTKESVTAFVEKALMWGGRRLDLSHPFVDARLPDGSRLHVAIPEITAEHWAVNIRKHLIRDKSLNDLSKYGVMSEEIAKYLTLQVRSGKNMLISGSTQAGKTTLARRYANPSRPFELELSQSILWARYSANRSRGRPSFSWYLSETGLVEGGQFLGADAGPAAGAVPL